MDVDFYPEDDEGGDPIAKKTAKMYDLMVPAGTKIRAFTRQEED